jgi:hypothetical protein
LYLDDNSRGSSFPFYEARYSFNHAVTHALQITIYRYHQATCANGMAPRSM